MKTSRWYSNSLRNVAEISILAQGPQFQDSYTVHGLFNVRFQVQTRQLRHDHPDSHYCAAQLKYLKEFVVKFMSNVCFVMEDDKHFNQCW